MNLSKIKSTLSDVFLSKKTFYAAIILWLGLQVFYIISYWGVPPSNDGSTYLGFAKKCIDLNTWYPNMHNINEAHLYAPGYVNLLILVHKLFGSFEYIKIVALLFNVGLLFFTYKIAKKVFSDTIARLSVILSCLTFSSYTVPIAISSEMPFIFAMMLALLLIIQKKPYTILLGGVFIGLGNWVRPVAIVFILTSLVYMFANKYRIYNYAILFIAIISTMFCIAKPVHDRIGKYWYTTSATGHNLAHATSGRATATPSFEYKKDEYYADLENKEYKQKLFEADKDVLDRALKWIKENPIDYLSLFPKKLVSLYVIDNWTIRAFKGKGFASLLKDEKSNKFKVYLMAIFQSIVYYVIMLLFLCYLIKNIKTIFRKENILLLVPALGTAMLLIMVVVDRYHQPFMPVITIYAASALFSFVSSNENKLPLSDNSI